MLQVFPGWLGDPGLFAEVRLLADYGGEDRATRYLPDGLDWGLRERLEADLGATRTFGVRPLGGEPEWHKVADGDLVYMPPGFQDEWEHCVPVEDEPGERVSLVFRTVRS